jgi:hypothetical protein
VESVAGFIFDFSRDSPRDRTPALSLDPLRLRTGIFDPFPDADADADADANVDAPDATLSPKGDVFDARMAFVGDFSWGNNGFP